MRVSERDVDEEFFSKEHHHHHHAHGETFGSHLKFGFSLVRNYLTFGSTSNAPILRGPFRVFLSHMRSGFKDKSYRRRMFNDMLIGFSIGAMCIPQGMSYSLLAGLPTHYGLYSNMIHPLGYFLLGTSNHIITGSAAIENLMIGESIDNLTNGGGVESGVFSRPDGAIALSIMCCVLYTIYYWTGLHIISDLMCDPVLSGFSTGSSLLVMGSQLKYGLGLYEINNQWTLPYIVYYICQSFRKISLTSCLVCLGGIAFLVLCKQSKRRFIPGPLLLIVMSIGLSYQFNRSEMVDGGDVREVFEIPVVGYIPSGLPKITNYVPKIQWMSRESTVIGVDSAQTIQTEVVKTAVEPQLPSFRQLFWESVKISCLLFVIHVSVAKTIAIRQEYQISVQDELLAFSAMNGLGAIVGGCYPPSTSISRSAASEGLGCTVGLQGPTSSIVVLIVLLFLTNWLRYLPLASLSAIVFVGCSASLVEFNELFKLWKLQKVAYTASTGGSSPDLLLWIISFTITASFGASEGIIVSVILSLVWIGKSILRPPFIELGRIKDTTIYRDVRRFPGLIELDPAIAIFRIDAPLNFCNSSYLERHIRQVIFDRFVNRSSALMPGSNSTTTGDDLEEGGVELSSKAPYGSQLHSPAIRVDSMAHYVFILDCSSVNGLDITSIGAIKRIVKHAASHGVIVAFSNWKGPQRDFLWRANFYGVVPPQRCFMSNHDAYLWATAVRNHPFVATEILKPMTTVNRCHSFSKTLTHTVTRNMSPPNTTLSMYRETCDEIEMHNVYEWDGLSALVPNVRIVEEQTAYGGHRRWEVSAVEDD